MMWMQQSELDELMALHELWVTSSNKQGKQLWLEDANLSELDLSGKDLWDSFLPCVNLDGANLAETILGRSNLYGSSLRHANLHRASLIKADMREAQADHAQFVGANLLRCELYDADLHGVSFDRAILMKTWLAHADLRGWTIRSAKLEQTSMEEAVLGEIDAAGATGSIMALPAFWETDGERQELDPEQLIAALQAAGAGEISAVAPRSPEDGIWKV